MCFPEQSCRRTGVLKCFAGMVMLRIHFCISGVGGGGRRVGSKSIFDLIRHVVQMFPFRSTGCGKAG